MPRITRKGTASTLEFDLKGIESTHFKLQGMTEWESFFGIDPDEFPEEHEKALLLERGERPHQVDRPFFRITLQEGKEVLGPLITKFLKVELTKKGNIKSTTSKGSTAFGEKVLKQAGNRMKQRLLDNLDTPPLDPLKESTKARKRANESPTPDKIGMDSGAMVKAIKSEVKKRGN